MAQPFSRRLWGHECVTRIPRIPRKTRKLKALRRYASRRARTWKVVEK